MRLMNSNIAFLAILLATPIAASAHEYVDPKRVWSTEFGQGHQIASVSNNAGGRFEIVCSGNFREGTPPEMAYVPSTNLISVKEGETLEVVMEIDQGSEAFHLTWSKGRLVGEFFNWKAWLDLERLIAKLRAGGQVRITIPSLKVQDIFTLEGSSRELKDILRNCPQP
jgi:hypothetical protein